ncbi:MAG: hypothetical protein IT205_04795 [Fimbriimonadaceae bacterium]|nr:hypothetical protein [Fimbriimonadaceae bacterium]
MLTVILAHLVNGPLVVERTYTLTGTLDTQGKVVIRRTLFDDGSLEWSDSAQFSDGDSQTVVARYNSDSSLKRWEFTMVSNKEKSVWLAEANGSIVKLSRPFYRSEALTVTDRIRKSPMEAGDPSKFWWLSKAPGADYAKKASFFDYGFSDAGDFGDVKLAILPDETLSILGKTQTVHVVERTNSYRRERWWIDDLGMPVKRAYFSSETSTLAYRLEIQK